MTRARVGLAAAVVVVGAAVTAVVLAATGGGVPLEKAPTPVLGKPLKSLVVYQRPRQLTHTPGPGERAIPALPGRTSFGLPAIVKKKPVLSLHVDYARVIPYDQGWRIFFDAEEASAFNDHTAFGNAYVVLIGGRATNLLFISDAPVHYGIGFTGQWPTKAAALAVAKSLTTSVTVAECTKAQIDSYKCT